MAHLLGSLVSDPDVTDGLVKLLVAATIALVGLAGKFLAAHTKLAQGARADAIRDKIADVASTVVRELAQTDVAQMRKATVDGKLTADMAAQAAAAAFEQTKAHLGGDAALAEIGKVLKGVDVPRLVTSNIQAAVHDLPTPPPAP